MEARLDDAGKLETSSGWRMTRSNDLVRLCLYLDCYLPINIFSEDRITRRDGQAKLLLDELSFQMMRAIFVSRGGPVSSQGLIIMIRSLILSTIIELSYWPNSGLAMSCCVSIICDLLLW